MNIDKIIRDMLLEDDKQDIRGFNYEDQRDILEKGRLYCDTFKSAVKDRPVKRLDAQDIPKFPGLAGKTEIAYISSLPLKDGAIKMFFAVQDPSTTKRSFFTYWVKPGTSPRKYTEGWGIDCPQMQETSEDLESLKPLAAESPNTKIWPKPGTLTIPSRGTCRDVIKLLSKCSKSTTTTAECTTDLWKNKVLAIQCGDKNFVSGAVGVGDEYNQISID